MKKLLTFLLTALLAFGVGWAASVATYTVTGVSSNVVSGTLSGAPSGVTVEVTKANGFNNSGAQITTGYSPFTIKVKGFTSSYKLLALTLRYCTNSSNGAGTVTAKLGNTSLGNPYTLTKSGGTSLRSAALSIPETVFDGNDLVITVNVTTNSVYVNSLILTYDTNGSATQPCAAPTFSPDGGSSTSGSLDVTISSATEGATIYYTTDNTDPVVNRSTSSIANGGTVHLTESCTIKALAAKSGMDNSTIVTSQSYSISSGSSGIPGLCDATIAFKSGNGSTDATSAMTANTIGDNVESGSDYISSFSNFERVFLARSGYGWKLGSSSNIGKFTVNLVTQPVGWQVTKIVVEACRYGATEGSLKVSTNVNTQGTVIDLTPNASFTEYEVEFDGSDITSFTIETTAKRAFVKSITLYYDGDCGTSTDPELSVSPNELSINVPYNESSASATFTVTGSNLTSSSVSVDANGADFSVSPTSIPVADGSVNQDVTVTYNGTSTTPVTGTVTVTSGDLSQTVTVTAQKELPPPPTMTVSTNSLTVGANGNSFNVTASNLTEALTVTASTGFSVNPTSLATDATYPAAVNVTYIGQALSATGNVTVSNTADNLTETVNVTYVYDGNMYIVGDVNNTSWDFVNGVPMTRNQDGTYSAHVTAQANGWYNGVQYAWLYFTKAVGSEAIVAANAFGPQGGDQWGMTPNLYDQWCDLDQNGDVNTIYMNSGSYEIVVDPVNNKFMITPDVAAPVITPATGTYSGTQEVTITCATPGAAIYYTTDGSEPSANNGTLYDGNAISISESVTLKAVAVSNGVTSSVASAEYLITPPFVSKDYEMLTNINDLVAGQTYLIVFKTANDAETAIVMGPVSNNIGVAVENVPETNGIITSTDAMAPVTLVGNTDNWKLLTSQGVLTAHDANNLYYDDPSHTWTIDKVDNKNTFKIQSNTYNDRYLQFNNNNNQHRFACYKATQQYVYIYKESSTPAILANPTTVSIELAAGEAQGSNTFTVGGRNLSEGVTLTLSAEDQAKGFSLSTNSISQSAALAGNVEVTVTYNGPGASETASITLSSAGATDVTVTVNATREPLTVTISPASCNFVGSVMSEPVTITANVPGATIEYSLDNGTTWQTYTDGITITIGQVNNSVTVMARATLTTGGNTYTSATVSETYTRQPKGETLYEKVTDESQIKAGEKYVIVYEGSTPVAFNGTYESNNNSFGSGVNVTWRTQNQVVDIANTDAIVFTLGGSKDNWTLKATQGYLESTNDDTGVGFYNNASSNYEWQTPSSGSGYGLTTCNRELRYNTQLADRGPFRLYTNSTGVPAYLYVLHPAVMAPVITPATGEYSEHQDVTITAESGTTVYYTTDGSDPTSSSTPYEGQFTVHYDATSPTTTIKAIAVDDEGNVSTIAEVVYTWIAPKVTIRPATRDVYNPTLTVVIGCNPVDATVYYTTDGSEPSTSNGTLYEGPFEVTFASLGDQVTVKAIAYNDDDVPSAVDAATYTYAEKVINVDAPFFSPLEGKDGGYSGIYYGDQTLEIATSTANADIYYEIEEVSGENPPSSVIDPTKSSTHYTGPYTMREGYCYRVKAIAYIGDFASQVSEGYYIIKTFVASTNVYQNLKDFNDNCPTGATATFVNPVQVVYHSTYTNNGEFAEYCYLRDNTDYACVYFGKRDTHDYHIFEMGDWLDGSEIAGVTNIWENNFHIQLGTGSHEVTSWPTTSLGNSEILPEEITNAVIVAGTATGSNSWGHYVHLRNTTLRDVKDYNATDPKHTGLINDGTADAYYYDKFYRWSAGTCSYNNHNDVINHVGDYDQGFFTEKQNDGATFDVYGIVDYYKPYNPPFEICPIDFLWIYKPVITPGTNLNCTSEQVVDITVETPDWTGATTPTIYYKTDDMDDWAEFIGPFVVNSDTHVQAYAEMPSRYDDMMRSEVVETEYKFANIKEPIITDDVDDNVIEVTTGNEEVNVTIQTNPESPEALTLYTLNGDVPTLENGIPVVNGSISLDPITETTTVTAISYLADGEGNPVLWSNPVTVTYTFVKSNGVVYDLVDAVTMDKVYVIVNKDAYMGLSTAQNGNNRGSTGVKFTDGTKEHVYGNDELALFVLESANAGRYYFKNINGNGYLTVTTNDVANLSTSATTSSYSEAEVSIDQANGNPATIRFNYDGTYRYLRYFAKGRTFTTNSDATLNQDVFLYGTESTPLAIIESEKTAGSDVQVTVADNLIGAWAVNGNGHKYLWAKDMGLSIDKTAPVAGQKDYVKNILHYQKHDWDQSNWVILDFSGLGEETDPEDFVGKKLTGGSITGWYVDDNNYRILLVDAPGSVDDADAGDYPGYGLADVKEDNPQSYGLGYNTYIPTNFYDAYMNAPYGEGFVAEANYALGTHAGDKLFFMNPKVQEVARVWGVYTQKDGQDVFTCFEPNLDNMVNGWGLKGAFAVEWDYNRVNQTTYGVRPSDLSSTTDANKAFMFHAAIVAKPTGGRRADAVGTADDATNMSDRFVIYPLDFESTQSNVVTGVQELKGAMKAVESVRYYNIMGMESKKPFEGINIVVTRYTDGSTSTTKILR